MPWATAGLISNPTAGQVIADTGPMTTSPFTPTLMCYSDSQCLITLRHRNATNTADVHSQQMHLGTFTTNFHFFPLAANVVVAANERLIMTVDTPFAGIIQCSIIF